MMGSVPSEHEFHCPQCGALLTRGADHCWKCGREFLDTGMDSNSPSKPSASTSAVGESRNPPPMGATPPRHHFSLSDEPVPLWKTLGLVAIVVVAAPAAFFTTCLGSFFVSMDMVRGGEARMGQAFNIGLVCGAIAAVAVLFGLVWLFWLRPRKAPPA